jgi:putative hemolysin
MSGNSPAGWTLAIFAASSFVLMLASAAQAALIYIDRARLRHMLDEGTPRARALTRLLDEPSSTFSTVLFVYTLAMATASAAGFWFIVAWWPVIPAVSVGIGLVSLLMLLLLQFIGRLVAVSRPTGVALAFVRPVELLTRLLRPALFPLVALERWACNALRLPVAATAAEAEERWRHLVEDDSALEEDEREMIAGVIELGDQPVREVMVPRIDIVALPASASVREALDCIVRTGHSRIPLYEDTIDNITGVVYAKDLLKHLRDKGVDEPVLVLAREPSYVPETKKVDELLHEMQLKRVHLAVVVDEYGGTAGLITIEDLIEEIVGEIQDEYDVEEAPIEQVSPSEAVFDARVTIRDVNDTLDLDLEDEDFDTLGGLVYHQLGKVPAVGDEVRVDGALVTVLATHGRRVKKVRVTKSQPAQAAADQRNG